MDKPVMVMMVGLAASGKSTYAASIASELNATVFSSDALRSELFGDVNDQAHNSELFAELHKRIKYCLKSGKSAVYDATNISSKRRRAFLQELKKIDCYKKCVIMATPYEQCIKNNNSRERKVPEEVIRNMYLRWNTPYWFEDWDDIEIKYWDGCETNKDVWKWIESLKNFSQDNPHHTLTLGEHCHNAGKALVFEKPSSGLFRAGLLHDCGKPYVKAFVNSKGEPTDIAHYYSHENVGAYEALFFECNMSSPLDVSIIVNLHMTPYYWEKNNNIKLRDKYRRIWGYKLFKAVMKLHEADKAAH